MLSAEEHRDPLRQVSLRRGPSRVLQGGWHPGVVQASKVCPVHLAAPDRRPGARLPPGVAACVRACVQACVHARVSVHVCVRDARVAPGRHVTAGPPLPPRFAAQRCKYDTCNCRSNEACLCAALSSYARACAARGLTLWGWRELVCSECCPLQAPRGSVGRLRAWPSLHTGSPMAAPPERRGPGGGSARCSDGAPAPSGREGPGSVATACPPAGRRGGAVPGTLAFGWAGVCRSRVEVGLRDQGQQAGREPGRPPAPHEARPSADKDVGSCPTSQTFLYNLTTCQQTCRSLSEPDTHCLEGFVPVDGCGCPEHTFLDEKSRCVPLAQCSCYHRGLYLEAGEVVLRQEERWWVPGAEAPRRAGTALPGGARSSACAPRQPPLTCLSLAAFAGMGGCSACKSGCSARVSGRCPGRGGAPPHAPAATELRWPLRPTGCAAPKVHVDCSNLTALAIRNPRPVSCQTLAAGYVRAGAGHARGRGRQAPYWP